MLFVYYKFNRVILTVKGCTCDVCVLLRRHVCMYVCVHSFRSRACVFLTDGARVVIWREDEYESQTNTLPV